MGDISACVFTGDLITCVFTGDWNACVFTGELMQGKKPVTDERNYSSLADEFDVAMVTAATEPGETVLDDSVDDVSTVRRRVTTTVTDTL